MGTIAVKPQLDCKAEGLSNTKASEGEPIMNLVKRLLKWIEAQSFLGEVVQDYGIISEDKFGGAFKKTSILLCKRQGKLQIVIKTASYAYLAASVKYEYIPADCASRLKSIIEDVETRSAGAE